jgi:hypothetical protein
MDRFRKPGFKQEETEETERMEKKKQPFLCLQPTA